MIQKSPCHLWSYRLEQCIQTNRQTIRKWTDIKYNSVQHNHNNWKDSRMLSHHWNRNKQAHCKKEFIWINKASNIRNRDEGPTNLFTFTIQVSLKSQIETRVRDQIGESMIVFFDQGGPNRHVSANNYWFCQDGFTIICPLSKNISANIKHSRYFNEMSFLVNPLLWMRLYYVWSGRYYMFT